MARAAGEKDNVTGSPLTDSDGRLIVVGPGGLPVLVESRPATITEAVWESGNLTSWTQDGVDYEATYDDDGNLLTQGPAT